MLVSAKDMMDKARDGKYAVGQFNINNLEWTKAILNTAQKLNSPVILGVSGGAGKYMTGFKVVADMVKAMDESLGITVPVALHLDHGTYDQCYDCIKAGFTSIMFDGSHFPIEENLAKTKELVAVAHKLGLSIEAEVGAIGGEEDGVIGANVTQILYKGTYYQVQIYTDTDEDFYIDTTDEWDIDDRVGVKVLADKIKVEKAEETEDEEV